MTSWTVSSIHRHPKQFAAALQRQQGSTQSRARHRRCAASACTGDTRQIREVRICTNQTCKRQGSKKVLKQLESFQLDDVDIKARSCGCLGECGSGPNVAILPVGKLVHSVGRHLTLRDFLGEHCGLNVVSGDRASTLLRLEGNELAQAGEIEAAWSKYMEALRMAPASMQHPIYSNLSLLALSAGNAEQAEEHAARALDSAPLDWTTAKIRMVEACLARGARERAQHFLNLAVAQDGTFQGTDLYHSLAARVCS